MASESVWPATRTAKLMDMTVQRLWQLAQEGIIPKAGRNRYAPFECNVLYIRYLRARLQSPELSDTGFHDAKLAKLKSEREQIELDMQIKRGERIPKTDVDLACKMIFRSVCGILKSNRNKVLTEAQINEIFDDFREVSKRFQNDYGNGSVLVQETA